MEEMGDSSKKIHKIPTPTLREFMYEREVELKELLKNNTLSL